jgi:hypothetical protein
MKYLLSVFLISLLFSCQSDKMMTHKTKNFKIMISKGSNLPFNTHLELKPYNDTLILARSVNVKVLTNVLQSYLKSKNNPEVPINVLKNSSLNLIVIQNNKGNAKDIPYLEIIDLLEKESYISFE